MTHKLAQTQSMISQIGRLHRAAPETSQPRSLDENEHVS